MPRRQPAVRLTGVHHRRRREGALIHPFGHEALAPFRLRGAAALGFFATLPLPDVDGALAR